MKITDWMLFWTALASITVSVGMVGGLLIWSMKKVVREEISEVVDPLKKAFASVEHCQTAHAKIEASMTSEIAKAIRELNGTYTRSALCKTLHAQMEARLETIDGRFSSIENRFASVDGRLGIIEEKAL